MNGVRGRRPSHGIVIDFIRVIFMEGGDSESGSWVGGGVEG